MSGVVIISKDELHKTLAEIAGKVLDEIEFSRPKPREVMTLAQLAEFWQVRKQTIIVWTKRPRNQNPLPVDYVGSEPRFFYGEIRQWSKVEKERRMAKIAEKVQAEEKKLQLKHC